MIPYFIFSIISFLYWFILESKFRPVHETPLFQGQLGALPIKLQQFINIFTAENTSNSFAYNVVLWFLPCLFVADVIYSRIKDKKLEIIYLIGLIAIYYMLIKNLPSLPWCLNVAIISVPFLALGYHFYKPILQFMTTGKYIQKNIILLLVSICSILLIIRYLNPSVNMMHNIIPQFYLFYPTAILGTLMVFSISQVTISLLKDAKVFKIFTIYRGSLIIMCIHEPIKRIVLVLASKLINMPTDIIRDNLLFSIGIMIIIILICFPFIYIIQNYLPWMTGKKISTHSNRKL